MKTIRDAAREYDFELNGKMKRLPDECGQRVYAFENGCAWVTKTYITIAYGDDEGGVGCFTVDR